MHVQALRYSAATIETDPVRTLVPAEDARQLAEALAAGPRPCALLVRREDRARLDGFKDEIEDAGQKHRKRPLRKYLLKKRRTPIVRVDYSGASQVKRSVRNFLEHARQEAKAYVLVVPDEVFESLWQTAAPPPDRRRAPEDSPRAGPVATPNLLMHVFAGVTVPKDLERRLVGGSLFLHYVRILIVRAAASSEPVLILGDTGTGKGLAAQLIHENSHRRNGRFVVVNCAAIPEQLLESELFGVVRGAYTGATQSRPGLFEFASGGTIFLDEIADLSSSHQAKVLRVVEERKARRVGGLEDTAVDARIVAATNRDLYGLVREGRFREDLFNRLRILRILTPSLSDCPEDIPAIAAAVWQGVTGGRRRALPEDAIRQLSDRWWPGNVRELKAILARLHSLFPKDPIEKDQVDFILAEEAMETALSPTGRGRRRRAREALLSLRRLRETEEVVYACRRLARSLARDRHASGQGLESMTLDLLRRLEELELVSLEPLQFPDRKTFFALCELKRRLGSLHRLLTGDVSAAADFARGSLLPDLDAFLETLHKDVGDLLRRT